MCFQYEQQDLQPIIQRQGKWVIFYKKQKMIKSGQKGSEATYLKSNLQTLNLITCDGQNTIGNCEMQEVNP